jgi:deazaflavin-dependent oxidoreductase (nitroreductase family)
MPTPRDRVERALRQGFRLLNRLMVLLWRLGLGPSLSLVPTITGRYLVLSHTGRKSGLARRTPLNYARVGETIYVTAGFGAVSDWYRNILAHPQVEIWLPDGSYAARAEELPDSHPQRLALLREVLKGSGFATLLAGINPYTFSNARLARTSRFYRLIAITPGAARRGPDGPGDLAWVWWPAAGLATILAALPRLRRRR